MLAISHDITEADVDRDVDVQEPESLRPHGKRHHFDSPVTQRPIARIHHQLVISLCRAAANQPRSILINHEAAKKIRNIVSVYKDSVLQVASTVNRLYLGTNVAN